MGARTAFGDMTSDTYVDVSELELLCMFPFIAKEEEQSTQSKKCPDQCIHLKDMYSMLNLLLTHFTFQVVC